MNLEHSEPSLGALVPTRDAFGVIYETSDRCLRVLDAATAERIVDALSSPTLEKLTTDNRLHRSRVVKSELSVLTGQPGLEGLSVLEQEKVAFKSFANEWSAEMLYEAATLTLDFAARLMPEGFELKEANPNRLQFDGPAPVWSDLLVVERRNLTQGNWSAASQFTQSFMLPLLAHRYLGMPLAEIFKSQSEGIGVSQVFARCGYWQLWRQPFLSVVTLPYWSERRANEPGGAFKDAKSSYRSRVALTRNYMRMKKVLAMLAPAKKNRLDFSPEPAFDSDYSQTQFFEKHGFVEDCLMEIKPRMVLDLGCGSGHFSELAAKFADAVVAVDKDAASIGKLWKKAKDRKLQILPLVSDFTAANRSFRQRAQGRFDAILLVGALGEILPNQPSQLLELVAAISEMTTAHTIVEFSEGAMSLVEFEKVWKTHFEVVHQKAVNPQRTLFHLRKLNLQK